LDKAYKNLLPFILFSLLAEELHLFGLRFEKSKFILQAGEKREKVELSK
jgi:hypothetical protein